jgi:hypothetical protein
MDADIERLELWKVLQSKGTDPQRSTVAALLKDATALLDHVIETFPTYTLHNRVHSINVAERMADLLGPTLYQLTALEAAMLILSAFWHDIGMVFTDDERTTLESEPYWREFLAQNPEAEIAFAREGGLSTEIAEWYCRWRHADRVYVHLNKQPGEKVKWGQIAFRDALGELCRSHNLDVIEIKTNDGLQTNFLEEADLKFCALLLRLADILDFDNTRSPEPVYQLLGLVKARTRRKAESDVEWRKHLASDGFRFPDERHPGYQLGFIAAPTHPAVEFDLRLFLDTIEQQLEQCQSLLGFCSARWQHLSLPKEISRNNIKSIGYKYGEYRFSLDQKQVLDLLMGENLYEDHYVFLRELLQNAIDTSRFREYYEHCHGNPDFRVKPISITEWRDAEGKLWIRFEDFGMGMDESIVRNHLLKVGASYYRTARFYAQVIRAQRAGAPQFVPISRFGIGLLSCFIAGERIDISTRHLTPSGSSSDPIRLVLDGLHGFYTLQSGHMQPLEMPSSEGTESGYRWEIGTTVAVRIDPRQEQATLDVGTLLQAQVISSPVPIEFNGQPLGLDYTTVIENPWCERVSVPLPSEERGKIDALVCHSFSEPLEVEFIPVDLSKHSPTREFKGEILSAFIRPSSEWMAFVEQLRIVGHIELSRESLKYPTPEGDPQAVLVTIRTQPYRNRQKFVSRLRSRLHEVDERFSSALMQLVDRIATAKRWEYGDPKDALSFDFTEYKEYGPKGEFYAEAACWISFFAAVQALPTMAQQIIKRLEEHEPVLVSHNGVKLPAVSTHSPREVNRVFLNPAFEVSGPLTYPARTWGTIALADSLRPEVDVARGALKEIPSHVYTTALTSLHEAVEAVGLGEYYRKSLSKFTALPAKEPPSLDHFLSDGLIKPVGVWLELPLYATDKETLSLAEIRDRLGNGEEVQFYYLPNGLHVTGSTITGDAFQRSFSRICGAVLADLTLNVEIRVQNTELQGFFAIPGSRPVLLPGMKMFPPFTFLPYNEPLFHIRGCGLNQNHPISSWLIEIAPSLAEEYPGVFTQLRALIAEATYSELIFNDYSGFSEKRFLSRMNEILERMKLLKPAFRPPQPLLPVEVYGLKRGMIISG